MTGRSARYASAASSRTSRSRTAPSRAAISRRPLRIALRPAGPERRAEDAPRGALPARRDAHRVELLGVLAGARAGLAGEHPGEVEAHDLAAGLGDVVVGGDARRSCRRRGGVVGDGAPRRPRSIGVRRSTDDGRPQRSRRRARPSARRRRPRRRSRSSSSRRGLAVGAPTLGVLVGVRRPTRSTPRRRSSAVGCPSHRRERGLELAAARRRRAGSAAKTSASAASRSSSPLISSASSSTNRSTTRAARRRRPRRGSARPACRRRGRLALAAQLADRHELDERRVAGQLEDQRPGVRAGQSTGRRVRSAGPSSSSRRDRAAGALARGERLDRDDRRRARLRGRGPRSRPGEGAVGRVDVAVLELRRARRGATR